MTVHQPCEPGPGGVSLLATGEPCNASYPLELAAPEDVTPPAELVTALASSGTQPQQPVPQTEDQAQAVAAPSDNAETVALPHAVRELSTQEAEESEAQATGAFQTQASNLERSAPIEKDVSLLSSGESRRASSSRSTALLGALRAASQAGREEQTSGEAIETPIAPQGRPVAAPRDSDSSFTSGDASLDALMDQSGDFLHLGEAPELQAELLPQRQLPPRRSLLQVARDFSLSQPQLQQQPEEGKDTNLQPPRRSLLQAMRHARRGVV